MCVTFPAPEHTVRGPKRKGTAECPLAGGGSCPAPSGAPTFVSAFFLQLIFQGQRLPDPSCGKRYGEGAYQGVDFAVLVGSVFPSWRRQVVVPQVTSLMTSAPTVVLSRWPSSLICLTPAGWVGSVRLAAGLGAALRTEGPINRWLLAPPCLSIAPHVNQLNSGLCLGSPAFLFLTLFSAL